MTLVIIEAVMRTMKRACRRALWRQRSQSQCASAPSTSSIPSSFMAKSLPKDEMSLHDANTATARGWMSPGMGTVWALMALTCGLAPIMADQPAPQASGTGGSSNAQLMQALTKRCHVPLKTLLTQRVGNVEQAVLLISVWTSLMCPACHDLHKKTIPALVAMAKKRSDVCLILQDNPIYPQSLCASAMVMACPERYRGPVLDFLFTQSMDPGVTTVQDIKAMILDQWTEEWGISRDAFEEQLTASQAKESLTKCFNDKKKECQCMQLKEVPYVVVASRPDVHSPWSVETLQAAELTSAMDKLLGEETSSSH